MRPEILTRASAAQVRVRFSRIPTSLEVAGVWTFSYRNPTNAVGGSFILSLHGKRPPSPLVSSFARKHRKQSERGGFWAEYERTTNFVGGIREGARQSRL